MEAQIFRALGDPLRLKIVKRLSGGSTHTMGDVTKGLGVSRQGARKQLQVLVSAKIVQLKPIGREVRVLLNASALKSGRDFIANLENQWDKRLRKLKEVVEKDS
ncbi:helix-turn-helix domain-containing protein [Candidatus Parcubacteria bacterium]|nr:helix-turn-helix domain-containing protein [Candidatus Parcubacteria bacterium]